DLGSRIGHTRRTRLAHESYVSARFESSQKRAGVQTLTGVLTIIVDNQLLLGASETGLFQEFSRRFFVLHDIFPYRVDRIDKKRGVRRGSRRVRQRDRQQKEGSHGHAQNYEMPITMKALFCIAP